MNCGCNHWLLSSNNIYFCKWQKADDKKKSKEDEQNLEEWLQKEVYDSLLIFVGIVSQSWDEKKSESRGPIVICYWPMKI